MSLPVPFLSVVVPTFREASNLRFLVERLSAVLRAAGRPFEVVFVDDDSRDGSEGIVAELAREGHPVRMITRVGERGLSSAVIRGFQEAAGEVLLCMDADLSHPPEAIPAMLERLEGQSADFVIGSRYVPGGRTEGSWGLFRWLNSKVATLMALPFTRVKDPMAGFFALPRSVFSRAVQLSPIGYKIGLELIVKCRCRNIHEVGIFFADRVHGQSKLGLREQLNYLRHLKRLADFRYGTVARLVQFCAVGATGMLVDLAAYWVLLRLGVRLEVARALAILLAMTWNYWLNRGWTFGDRPSGSLIAQYLRFVATCSLGAALSWSVSVGLSRGVPLFRNHIFLAAVLGIVSGTLSNFLLSHFWVFRKTGGCDAKPTVDLP